MTLFHFFTFIILDCLHFGSLKPEKSSHLCIIAL